MVAFDKHVFSLTPHHHSYYFLNRNIVHRGFGNESAITHYRDEVSKPPYLIHLVGDINDANAFCCKSADYPKEQLRLRFAQ